MFIISFFHKGISKLKRRVYRYFRISDTYAWIWRSRVCLTLRKLIRNRRVLIIGSGPSARELENIPEDVLVFCCNRSPKVLIDKKIDKIIDLYTTSLPNIEYDMVPDYGIRKIVKNSKINLFIFDDIEYAKEVFKDNFSTLIYDSHKDNFYLKKLINPIKINQIKGNSIYKWASTGMRLLQYALYFGAKEIYIIGIDLNDLGQFDGYADEYRRMHFDIDYNFLQVIVKKYNNIYSASENSSITEYIPYKVLF